jgi:membrane protein
MACALLSADGMLTVFKRAFSDFNDDECPVRAAALAYYTVFALPPLLVLLIMLAGALWDPQDVRRAMEGQFAALVGGDAATTIHDMIESGEQRKAGVVATILGFGALLFGATGAFLQLQSALNRAWEVRPDPKRGGIRNFLTKRLLSLGMILGVAFLTIVSLALSALLGAFGDTLTFIPAPVLLALNFALSFAVLTVLFASIFKLLPDAKIEWRHVWVGATVTSLLFVIGKFAIGLYLGRSSPGDAYGAASVLAVILVWVYYAGMIVLFGAEFTQAWAHQRGAAIEPEPGALRVDRDAASAARLA